TAPGCSRTSLPTPRSSSPCRNPARSPTTAAEAAGPLGSLGTPRRNRGGVPRPRWRSLGAGHSASIQRWSAETTVEVTGRRALRVDTAVERRDRGGGHWAPGTPRRNHYGVPRPRCTHSGLGTPPLPWRSLLSATRQRRRWLPPQAAIGSGRQG